MNEAETRAEHIDPALESRRLGRGRGQPHPARIPDHAGPPRRPRPARQAAHRRLRAGLSQPKLAVVEAKAWDEELTEGVAQAKNYAGKLAVRFTYATNGQGIYGIDMETGHGRRGAALSRRRTNSGT